MVVLFYNAFHFSESTHKNLHIRITVRFECIGDFIQPVGNFHFGFFDFYLQRFSFFTFEKPLCIGKLLFQLWQNFISQVFDFYRLILYLYHQVSHMAELCHINIKRRLGRHIFFPNKFLQKIFCLCYNPTEQIRQPAFAFDRLACFFVYLGLFDL